MSIQPNFRLIACAAACAAVTLAPAALPTRVVAQNAAAFQSADDEFDARRFRDSISHITERRVLRDIQQRSSRRNTADGEVAAGLAALRLFELSHLSSDAKDARRHFESAHTLDQLDPWPLYGWAVATLPQVKPDEDAGRFGFAGDNKFMQDVGLDPRSRARRALEKAVKLDPRMSEAAELLSTLAVETRDESAIRQASTALHALTQENPDDPRSRIALANTAIATGDLETAAAVAKAAASLATGAEAAAAHHQAARALLRMPGREAEGAAEYFAGLRNASREEVLRYFDELRGIATNGEMAQLERMPVVIAEEWITDFWNMHAAMSAVSVPHRIAAHYQRLAYAESHYVRRQRFGAPTMNALLFDRPKSTLDDRGVVYIRHGEPDEIVSSRGTQSWLYRNEGETPVLYHFRDGATEEKAGFNDWYLMYNLPCDADFMDTRAVYDKRLSPLIFHCDTLKQREVSARVRRDVYEGLRTDVDPAGFRLPLAASYDIYTFRGARQQTDIVAALGVQAARMKPLILENGDRLYSVNTSVIVFDTATRAVMRKDTSIEAHAFDAATRGSIVLGNVAFAASPARGMVHRVSVADAYEPARGHLYGGPLRVPDYSGDTLMISDIVLAAPDSVGTFTRGAVSLTLVPWQVFPRGKFRLFYELYNVSPGNPYTTELVLQAVSGSAFGAIGSLLGRKPAISLRFEDVAPASGTVIQQVRDATANLSAGEYKLTVRITDNRTGQKIERVRPVRIGS